MSTPAKSGAQIGEENFQKLQNYIASLEQQGQQVPSGKDGRPNLSAISLACGFDRQVLYKNPRCKELLESKFQQLGGSGAFAAVTPKRSYDPKDKRIRELEGKVSDLTEQLAEAHKLLHEAQIFQKLYEHVQETGRDIIP